MTPFRLLSLALLAIFAAVPAFAHAVAEGDKGYIQEIAGVHLLPFVYLGDNASKSIVLRGTSEVLALNFNAITLTGNISSIFIEWTEESV